MRGESPLSVTKIRCVARNGVASAPFYVIFDFGFTLEEVPCTDEETKQIRENKGLYSYLEFEKEQGVWGYSTFLLRLANDPNVYRVAPSAAARLAENFDRIFF